MADLFFGKVIPLTPEDYMTLLGGMSTAHDAVRRAEAKAAITRRKESRFSREDAKTQTQEEAKSVPPASAPRPPEKRERDEEGGPPETPTTLPVPPPPPPRAKVTVLPSAPRQRPSAKAFGMMKAILSQASQGIQQEKIEQQRAAQEAARLHNEQKHREAIEQGLKDASEAHAKAEEELAQAKDFGDRVVSVTKQLWTTERRYAAAFSLKTTVSVDPHRPGFTPPVVYFRPAQHNDKSQAAVEAQIAVLEKEYQTYRDEADDVIRRLNLMLPN